MVRVYLWEVSTMKWIGKLGYVTKVEHPTKPGIFIDKVIERTARGNIANDIWRRNEGEHVSDEISVTDRISILADQYTWANKHTIAYVVIDGIPWKVSTIENERPRMWLNVGRRWTGERPTDSGK